MLIKQVMARPVPTHPKWKYSLNRESMIFFFTRKYYMAPMWFMRKAGNNQKRMAYSTIFPAILYRMKCPYSPANYLKGDYEVRAVTMKEQRTTGGELKKCSIIHESVFNKFQ